MIDLLVVASKNPDKISEIESVLVTEGLVGEIVRGLTWDDIPETGTTLEENALLKARTVAAVTGLPALADDTGLEVVALGNRPGVDTAFFAGPQASYSDNVEKMLAVMKNVSDRRATFRSVLVVVWPDGRELMAEGRLAGAVAVEMRGGFGFGYDPIFEVGDRTLGEMDAEEKNRISHRASAIRELAERLRERSLR
ncbi:MAG: RdgB/HAM1 family non-canonical purine NTP pyrophosphatase [Acidimicrobiia bacterium]